MIIDFKEIEEQILPSFKGGEKEMQARIFSDDKAKIMCNRLQPGASIGYHRLFMCSKVRLRFVMMVRRQSSYPDKYIIVRWDIVIAL